MKEGHKELVNYIVWVCFIVFFAWLVFSNPIFDNGILDSPLSIITALGLLFIAIFVGLLGPAILFKNKQKQNNEPLQTPLLRPHGQVALSKPLRLGK